jgi:hypothetical protein
MTFQCFSATQENIYPSVRAQRWFNLDALQNCHRDIDGMAQLIVASIPAKANAVRIHISGDFYSSAYFLAWCKAAELRPAILFYAYTKQIKVWLENQSAIPSNLVLTASVGGKDDALIFAHDLRRASVVFSVDEAHGLPIDHDDTHAMDATCKEFVLLVHNVQPKGSQAAAAVKALNGLGSYSGKTMINAQRAKDVDLLVTVNA